MSETAAAKLLEAGATTPYRHQRVWAREETTGPERLCIGGGPRPIDLLLSLAREVAEPLFILAVLHTPRRGSAAKFESTPLRHAEVAGFFDHFEDLFANDARLQGWIGSTSGSDGLVVLDEHDLLYAYGPLQAFELRLGDLGYIRGRPQVPFPHEHRYNAEFDPLEAELRGWHRWRRVLPFESSAE